MIKLLLPMARAALAKATIEQRQIVLTHAYTLLSAIVRADREVADIVLDALDAPDDIRDLVFRDLWVFDDKN